MSKRLFLPVLLALIALTACRQSAQQPTANPSIQIELTADPAAPVVGASTLTVTVKDGSGAPVDSAKVSVRGDMNHAGMKPVLGETDESENGVYRIPFEWTMGGDWFVTVTVTLSDGSTASQTFDFSVRSE